jgi:hypothetical protein
MKVCLLNPGAINPCSSVVAFSFFRCEKRDLQPN